MVRGLVSQIYPKKELKFWTTLIIVLLKEQSTVYIHGKLRPSKSNIPKERAKILDDFDHCVIKRTIHGLHSRKIAPTVSIIHKEIKDSIKISKSKLTLTLIDLGYTCKKIGDNRRVLCDQVSIINDRCNYLRQIKSFREAGYDIMYMDETWVNQKSLHRLYVASK